MNGFGVLTHSTGDRFEGNFLNNKAHGYGYYVNSYKDHTYEGNWLKNQKHGKGKELYPDGTVYNG